MPSWVTTKIPVSKSTDLYYAPTIESYDTVLDLAAGRFGTTTKDTKQFSLTFGASPSGASKSKDDQKSLDFEYSSSVKVRLLRNLMVQIVCSRNLVPLTTGQKSDAGSSRPVLSTS